MRSVRLSITAAVALLAACTFATPAHASTQARPSWQSSLLSRARAVVRAQGFRASSFAAPVHALATVQRGLNDASGDVPDPSGDIVHAAAGLDSTSSVFTLQVASPTDPATDPNWLSRESFANGSQRDTLALWVLDIDFDGNPDYLAAVQFDDSNTLRALLVAFTSDNFCVGSESFDGTEIKASFSAGCPHFGSFDFAAEMVYDDTPGDTSDEPQIDDVPEFPNLSAPVPVHRTGYGMLGSSGLVYGFGNAPSYGGNIGFVRGIASRADGTGYWLADAVGHVFTRGRAAYKGGASATPFLPGEIITTMAVTPSNKGYWLFSNKGRVFPFGDAHSFGDLRNKVLNGPIIASVATPTGNGYYMVGSDGGIFTFGDARFRGSTGNKRLNAPIVGIAPTPDNTGYWLVASDGGVFSFNAPFRGSLGGRHLNKPIVGMVAYGNGYLLVGSDGGVFDFSNKRFLGSLGATQIPAPIIAIVAFATP